MVSSVMIRRLASSGRRAQARQQAASRSAGIPARAEIALKEYPSRRGLLNLPWKTPIPQGSEDQDPLMEALRTIVGSSGRPLPMVLPGSYPEASE